MFEEREKRTSTSVLRREPWTPFWNTLLTRSSFPTAAIMASALSSGSAVAWHRQHRPAGQATPGEDNAAQSTRHINILSAQAGKAFLPGFSYARSRPTPGFCLSQGTPLQDFARITRAPSTCAADVSALEGWCASSSQRRLSPCASRRAQCPRPSTPGLSRRLPCSHSRRSLCASAGSAHGMHAGLTGEGTLRSQLPKEQFAILQAEDLQNTCPDNLGTP